MRHGIAGSVDTGQVCFHPFIYLNGIVLDGQAPCLHGTEVSEKSQTQDECIRLVVGFFARLIVKNGYPFEVICPMHSLKLVKALDLERRSHKFLHTLWVRAKLITAMDECDLAG